MTTVSTHFTPEAVDSLVELIRDWRKSGRVTTTAGLKAALQQRTNGVFSEQALGFTTFRDFVQAAAATGRIELRQLPSGHWIALLPGESLDDVPTTTRTRPASAKATELVRSPAPVDLAGEPPGRLRPEVWTCFVDWATDQRRLWDRRTRRGVMVPVSDDGRPAWETTPERFVEMPAADMTTQVAWMREWASALPDETTRTLLLTRLSDGAQRGQFRQELTRLGLLAAWRTELQRRVFALAASWARDNGVDVTDLLDPRTRSAPQRSAAVPQPGATPTDSHDELARLRSVLHLVIDSMTLAELASLPVRAEYLLRVRG